MIDTAALKNRILALAMNGQVANNKKDVMQLFDRLCDNAFKIDKNKVSDKNYDMSELPFEIPDNWKWVWLGDIFQHNTGKALNSSNTEGVALEYITTSNLYWDKFELNELKSMLFKDSEIEKCTVKKGDLLICEGGDIGRSAIWSEDYEMRIQNHIHRLRPYVDEICVRFYYYVMMYYKNNGLISGRGIGLQGLSSKRLHSILVPLPDVETQFLITEKIDESFSVIDTIDELQHQYSSDLEVLKSKIIDAGIQGKLTEQLPEDGTAEELLKQIAEEKKLLIKEKEIKATKSLPEITEDEIPFEIPKSWKWVRIQDIIVKDLGGGTPSKAIPEYWDNGEIPWASVKDFSAAEGGYLVDTIDHITQEGLDNSASNIADEKAIIICMRMGLGKIARVAKPMAINQDLRAIWLNRAVLEDFFILFYSSLRIKGRGMTVEGIRKEELMSMVFPLPPIKEQRRIVDRIQQALNCVGIKK